MPITAAELQARVEVDDSPLQEGLERAGARLEAFARRTFTAPALKLDTAAVFDQLNRLNDRLRQTTAAAISVNVRVETGPLETGLREVAARVAGFRAQATATVGADDKPLEQALQAGRNQLAEFERQVSRTARELGGLKAPDLASRLQVRFPEVPQESVQRLAEMRAQIDAIRTAARTDLLTSAFREGQQQLQAFERELQRTRQELGTLQAPDLASKLQVRFPRVPEESLRDLGRMREQIEAIREAAGTNPLAAAFRESQSQLQGFERELERARRQLAELKAPDLGGQIAARFPGVAPDQLQQLTAIRAEIDRIRQGAASDPLAAAFRRSQQELGAFDRELERTQRQLAELKAPDLAGRLQVKFPTVAPEQVQQLASMRQEIAGIQSAAAAAKPSLTGIGDALHNILSGGAFAGLAAVIKREITDPIFSAGRGFLDAAVEMDSLRRSLAATMGNAGAAARELDRLRQSAKLPGLGFQEAVEGSVRLQNAGIAADEARRLMEGFARAISAAGGRRQDLAEITRQLQQIASEGKVTLENLRPILDRAPALGRTLLQSFGSLQPEKLAKAGITAREFFQVIEEGLSHIKAPADSVRNQLDNFADTIFQARARIGQALLPLQARFLETVTPLIERVSEAFSRLSPSVQQFVAVGAGISAILAPLAPLAVGVVLALRGLAPAISGAFAGLAAAVPAVGAVGGALTGLGPIVAVAVAGIGALGLAYAANLGGIRAAVNETLSIVGDLWRKHGAGVATSVATFMGEALTFIGTGLETMVRAVNTGLLLLQGRFRDAGAELKRLWQANQIDAQPQGSASLDGLKRSIAGIGDAFKRGAQQAQESWTGSITHIDLDARAAANKAAAAFSTEFQKVRKELLELRAPDLLAKLRIEYPGVPQSQLQALAAMTQARDAEKQAVERAKQALDSLHQKLGTLGTDLLRLAEQLPERVRGDVETFARSILQRQQAAAQVAVPQGALPQAVASSSGPPVLPPATAAVAGGAWQDVVRHVASDIGLRISSFLRPGAITVTGRQSLHATGEAIDFAGTRQQMSELFQTIRQEFAGSIRELFFTPLGSVKNNQFYPPGTFNAAVEREHFGHVHVALSPGAMGSEVSAAAIQQQQRMTVSIRETTDAHRQLGVVIRETDPAHAQLRVGDTVKALAERLVSVRQQIAETTVSSAAGRVEIGFLGDAFAKSQPWVRKLADALANAEDQLRGLEITRKVGDAWNQARVSLLAAAAATDEQRAALQTLGLSFETLSPKIQARIRDMVQFTDQAKATGSLRDLRNELAQLGATTDTERASLGLLGKSFASLRPDLQATVGEIVAFQAAIASRREVDALREAVAALALENQRLTAGTEQERAALDLTRRPLQALQADVLAAGAAARSALDWLGRMPQVAARLREAFQSGKVLSLPDLGQAVRSAVAGAGNVKVDGPSQALGAALQRFQAAIGSGIEQQQQQALDDLSEALKRVGGAAGATVPAVERLRDAGARLQEVFRGEGEREFAEILRQQQQATDAAVQSHGRLLDQLRNLDGEFSVSARSLEFERAVLAKTGGSLDEFRQHTAAAGTGLGELTDLVRQFSRDVASQKFGASSLADLASNVAAAALGFGRLDDAVSAYTSALREADRAEQLSQARAQIALLQQRAQVTRDLQTRLRETTAELGALTGRLSIHALAVQKLGFDYTQLTDAQKSLADELVNRTLKLDKLREFTDGVRGVFTDMFQDLRQNGFGRFFADIATGFENLLYKLATEYLASQFANLVVKGLGSVFGGGFDQILGGLSGARAGGGPVEAGQAYLVGEPGPEVFVPRQSGAILNAGQLASAMKAAGVGGGGDTHYHVSIAWQTPDANSARRSAPQVAAAVSRALDAERKRRGG